MFPCSGVRVERLHQRLMSTTMATRCSELKRLLKLRRLFQGAWSKCFANRCVRWEQTGTTSPNIGATLKRNRTRTLPRTCEKTFTNSCKSLAQLNKHFAKRPNLHSNHLRLMLKFEQVIPFSGVSPRIRANVWPRQGFHS